MVNLFCLANGGDAMELPATPQPAQAGQIAAFRQVTVAHRQAGKAAPD
jgi:hypothetical protein